MTPELSILIVNWNGKALLRNCLESLLKESSELDAEIIVVDNGSSDGSPEMVKEFFKEVKLICNRENVGFARGNNIGLKECRGELICLVNSDVEAVRGSIQCMVPYMREHPEVGMMGPKVIDPASRIMPNYREFPSLWNFFCRALALDKIFPPNRTFGGYLMNYFDGTHMRKVDVIVGTFWLLRRKALDEAGWLDEDFFLYGEDIDLCKRLKESGWDILYFPEAEIMHHGGGSSQSDPIRFFIEQQRSNYLYWRKHHRPISGVGFFLILMLHQMVRSIFWSFLFMANFRGENHQDRKLKIKRSLKCIASLPILWVGKGGRTGRWNSEGTLWRPPAT
jgi:GT2 family glycosyltransferase